MLPQLVFVSVVLTTLLVSSLVVPCQCLATPSVIVDIQERRIPLPGGTTGEVYASVAINTTTETEITPLPALAFIHGSFHSSWCWTEHYVSYFAALGHPCFIFSLRGTGGTPVVSGVTKVGVDEHVADIDAFLRYVHDSDEIGYSSTNDEKNDGESSTHGERSCRSNVVVIAHSMGGIVLQKYLEACQRNPDMIVPRGVVLMCSVPPSGNGRMMGRIIRQSIPLSWKIILGFAFKRLLTDERLCRELFFGGNDVDGNNDDKGITDEEIQRYQSYFRRDTDATIDLFDLAWKLPSDNADDKGRAPFIDDPVLRRTSALVLGATNDCIVDIEGVKETARYFNVDPVFVEAPHDVMLGEKWRNGADAISKWLEGNRELGEI